MEKSFHRQSQDGPPVLENRRLRLAGSVPFRMKNTRSSPRPIWNRFKPTAPPSSGGGGKEIGRAGLRFVVGQPPGKTVWIAADCGGLFHLAYNEQKRDCVIAHDALPPRKCAPHQGEPTTLPESCRMPREMPKTINGRDAGAAGDQPVGLRIEGCPCRRFAVSGQPDYHFRQAQNPPTRTSSCLQIWMSMW